MGHKCHAHGCTVDVPPKMFMCKPHWFKLRRTMRDAIWREYRPGQERDKMASQRYLCVQQWAIAEVAFKPNDEAAARAAAPYMLRALELRKRCIADNEGDPLEGLVDFDAAGQPIGKAVPAC